MLQETRTWLITGCAGFIGSNLLEALLKLDQKVIGFDNFSTGTKTNLEQVKVDVGEKCWSRFSFVKADLCNYSECQKAVAGVDYVLHQAALGSVTRSIESPLLTHQANLTGFLNILDAAKNSSVKSFTYAASSSTYGDDLSLPKVEGVIGNPLSPYAVTKYANELYAQVYNKCYDFKTIGLRYFNVFGKRQNPNGAYAAVIPLWIKAMLNDENIYINGDGYTSRDFCYVDNVVQANILAALAPKSSKGQVYNIAAGDKTSLNDLFKIIKASFENHKIEYKRNPIYRDFRKGDIGHSQADISKAIKFLKYNPSYKVIDGLENLITQFSEEYKSQLINRTL